MQKFCQLNSCETFSKTAKEDCFIISLKTLDKELKSLRNHYFALKEEFLKKVDAESRLERKYKEEKKKNKDFAEKLLKTEKRKPQKLDFKASPKSKVLGNISANNAFLADESSSSFEGLFKPRATKKQTEKENSPKKKGRIKSDDGEKLSMALNFTSCQPDFRRAHSSRAMAASPKILKQPKLSFTMKQAAEVARSKTTHIAQPRIEDSNETFCESFLIEKAKISNQNSSALAKVVTNKKSSSTTDGLFQFVPIKASKATIIEPRSPVEAPKLQTKVKQEKFSEDLFKDVDMDSQGSSVELFVEEDEEPFIIEDTVLSEYGIISPLKHNEKMLFDETEAIVIPSLPPRRRKIIYAECRECNEFYDDYAARFGATQADDLIRDCPRKCKGYGWRKKQAEPPLPEAHSFVYRNTDNQTPEGFWNVSITKTQDDDPDRTQDGL